MTDALSRAVWLTPCDLPWPGTLYQMACSPHGQHVALTGSDGLVTIYDLGLLRADLKPFGLDW
jgi:hypothetical protein